MPSNSSLAAKKRSVNAVRKKTRKRLMEKEKRSGISGGDTSYNHEKRRKLYSHQKEKETNMFDFVSSKDMKKRTDTKLFDSVSESLSHKTQLFMDCQAREAHVINTVGETRKRCTITTREKARVLVVVKNRKHAIKLAAKLGWNGKNTEVLRKIKTSKHKTGSLGRYVDFKGIGILDLKSDSEDEVLAVIKQLQVGQLHTIIICANPSKDGHENTAFHALRWSGIKKKFSAVIALTAPTGYEQYKDRSCFADKCIHTMLLGSKKNTENVYIKIKGYANRM